MEVKDSDWALFMIFLLLLLFMCFLTREEIDVNS